ncbi:MAG: PspA-associated protein PspAA [Acidimicrobiales bacterium]
MIVRILGEGQFEVPDDVLGSLEELDAQLNAAMEAEEEERFGQALEALAEAVRSSGQELDPTTIVPSDLTVPHKGATIAEVRELLASDTGDAQTATEGV